MIPQVSALALMFFWGSLASAQDASLEESAKNSAARLIDVHTSSDASVADLVSKYQDFDVLFLGELHDNDDVHAFQLEVIQALHDSGRDMVISMEMFERDVQGVVDDYLAGRIDEPTFKSHSRPWKNYDEHYRAIIEFAKDNNLRVIAGNAPRGIASSVGGGKPDGFHSGHAARQSSAQHDAYYERFRQTMVGHVGTENKEAMERMYRAQCLKDDTMAESIVDFLSENPHRQPLVVHLCGNFHSDYGQGTAQRVLSRRPLLKIMVVTVRAVDDVSAIPEEVNRHLADYALLVVKPSKSKDEAAK